MFLLALLCTRPAITAEIYSNATGGGPWSDPETWRGGTVPVAEDDVVIARDDVVTFDRNDDGQITCHQLSLDPRSVLQFKSGGGTTVLCVSGVLESYGYIKLDASKAAADQQELRFVAELPEERAFRIPKGGGLVLAGRQGLPKGRRNALIRSLPPKVEPPAGAPPPDPSTILEAGPGATFDVQRGEFVNMYVQASYIDNTGAKPGERLNIIRNRFTGASRLSLTVCDSAVVAENLFERVEPTPLQQPALYLVGCPLIEVRGNTIRGAYSGGITCYGQNECMVINNLIEKCPQGVYWYGSGFMIKQLHIRQCDHGMTLTSAAGTLEDITIEGSKTAYYHGGAAAQFTNLEIRDMVPFPDGYMIYYSSGPLTLLNCDIQPDQIKFYPAFVPEPVKEGKPRLPTIQSLSFLVAQLSGQVPPGASIEVRTSQPALTLAPGAQDPNVRNSPAPILKNGLTPLPKTLEPIIVRGWQFDPEGKLQKSPEYQLNVTGPAAAAGGERKLLKSLTLTPSESWYREDPNAKKPTIEVTLP